MHLIIPTNYRELLTPDLEADELSLLIDILGRSKKVNWDYNSKKYTVDGEEVEGVTDFKVVTAMSPCLPDMSLKEAVVAAKKTVKKAVKK